MQDYSGQVVAITGAANGMGKELARRFGAAGAKLALGDIDAENLAAVKAELTAKGVIVIDAVFECAASRGWRASPARPSTPTAESTSSSTTPG